MSESCTVGVACCPNLVFPQETNNIAASLSGLVWRIPCLSKSPPYSVFACQANNPANQVAQLTGNFGQTYQVSLLVRGVTEYAKYTAGSVVSGSGGRMIAGGTPVADGHNIYVLTVSNPAQSYYINMWDGDAVNYGSCHIVRYNVVLLMKTGATIGLTADVSDGQEATNLNNLSCGVLAGEPALNSSIVEPFDGQWLELDVTNIE